MKKNRFFWASAAIAALTLTACADQDEFNQNDVQTAAVENAPGAIQFGTYLGANSSTRAWEATESYTAGTLKYGGGVITTNGSVTPFTASLHDAEFGVFAYQTGTANWSYGNYAPEFMYNQYIQWSGTTESPNNSWYYAPVKYWPNGIDKANADNSPSNTAVQESGEQKLSFFAYAPYTSNLVTGTGAAATIHSEYASADYGAIPESMTEADIFKTSAWKSLSEMKTARTGGTYTGGIVGMTSWTQTKGPWLNYVMHNDDASTEKGLDLLWGLRGKFSYSESDQSDNTIAATGELGKSYNTDLTKQIVGEKVKFLFKHALAKIGGSSKKTGSGDEPAQSGLKIVVDVDDNKSPVGETGNTGQTTYFPADFDNLKTLVTVNSIHLRDMGTYATEAGSVIPSTTKSNLKTAGWFNIATGKWDTANSTIWNVESTVAYGAKAELKIGDLPGATELNRKIKEVGVGTSGTKQLDKTNAATEYKWVNDASTTLPTGVLATKALPVYSNADNAGIMLIPSDDIQTFYVTIDYFVRTADKQLSKGYSEVRQIITNKVDVKGLEANKYYTLIIHLGLTSVKFEAVVADWAMTSDATYDEDGKTTEGTDEVSQSVWLPSNVVNTTTITASAGTNSKKVTVAGHATTYTVTLDNLTAGNTVSVSARSGAGIPNTTNVSLTDINGTALIDSKVPANGKVLATVTLVPNNTGDPVENSFTVTENDGTSDVSTTTVTITQQPAVLTLSAPASIASTATTFIATLTNEGGASVAVTGTYAMTPADHYSGTEYSYSVGTGDDANKLTVSSIAQNQTVKPITLTLTLTQVNNPSVNVVQEAGELALTVVPGTGGTWTEGTKTVAFTKDAIAVTGGSSVYSVTVNGSSNYYADCKFTVSSADGTSPLWLSVASNGSLSAAENTGSTARKAKVTITYDGATYDFIVEQAGTSAP